MSHYCGIMCPPAGGAGIRRNRHAGFFTKGIDFMTKVMTAAEIKARTESGTKIHPYRMRAWDGALVAFQELNGLQIHEWDAAGVKRAANDAVTLMDTGTGAEHLVKLSMVECEFDENQQPIPGTAKRIFGDSRAETMQVRQLGGALQEAYLFCLKINQLRRVDEEQVEKNSSPTPDSDSGVTSPTDGAAA